MFYVFVGVCGLVYLRLIFKSCHVSNVLLIFCRYLFCACVGVYVFVQNAVRCVVWLPRTFFFLRQYHFYGLSFWDDSDLIFQFKICTKI